MTETENDSSLKPDLLQDLLESSEPNFINRMLFALKYSSQDVFRRKVLFMVAFLAVFVSIFSTLIINVFVKKGSLIFVKMSEDLQIDAVITPTFRKRDPDTDVENKANFFRFNYTRIREA